MAELFSVVDPHYCEANEMKAVLLTLSNGSILVANIEGSINLIAKEVHRTLAPNLRIICGVDGMPIVTMKPKVLTAHHRWEVFRGDRQEPEDLIFTAKTHKIISRKTNLDVFLASNREEKIPDFKVKGKFSDVSCTIYAGDKKIAELQKEDLRNINNILQGDDNFMVTIQPRVDHIFVVALIMILEETSPTFKFTYAMAASTLGHVFSIIKCIYDGSSSS